MWSCRPHQKMRTSPQQKLQSHTEIWPKIQRLLNNLVRMFRWHKQNTALVVRLHWPADIYPVIQRHVHDDHHVMCIDTVMNTERYETTQFGDSAIQSTEYSGEVRRWSCKLVLNMSTRCPTCAASRRRVGYQLQQPADAHHPNSSGRHSAQDEHSSPLPRHSGQDFRNTAAAGNSLVSAATRAWKHVNFAYIVNFGL